MNGNGVSTRLPAFAELVFPGKVWDGDIGAWRRNANVVYLQSDTRIRFLHGPRGTGKTIAVLVDFARGLHFGSAQRGIVVRKTHRAVRELFDMARSIYRNHDITYRESSPCRITFPNGAIMAFDQIESSRSLNKVQGHTYTWGFADELTQYETSDVFNGLQATLRPLRSGQRVMMTGTANPYCDDETDKTAGGSEWVYERFIKDREPRYIYPVDPGDPSGDYQQVAIPSNRYDNPVLLESDPDYWDRIANANRSNRRMALAWAEGLWLVQKDSAFGDVWNPSTQSFQLYGREDRFILPQSWKYYRALDWGQYDAFCYMLVGVADGQNSLKVVGENHEIGELRTEKGDLVIIDEIYGYDWQEDCGLRWSADQIADHIAEIEARADVRVLAGPGDLLGEDDADRALKRRGYPFKVWKKPPKSRIARFKKMRSALYKSARCESWESEFGPALYYSNRCEGFIKTMPMLLQSPGISDIWRPKAPMAKKYDHAYDAAGYALQMLGGRS
jgi:hypothetical protein